MKNIILDIIPVDVFKRKAFGFVCYGLFKAFSKAYQVINLLVSLYQPFVEIIFQSPYRIADIDIAERILFALEFYRIDFLKLAFKYIVKYDITKLTPSKFINFFRSNILIAHVHQHL